LRLNSTGIGFSWDAIEPFLLHQQSTDKPSDPAKRRRTREAALGAASLTSLGDNFSAPRSPGSQWKETLAAWPGGAPVLLVELGYLDRDGSARRILDQEVGALAFAVLAPTHHPLRKAAAGLPELLEQQSLSFLLADGRAARAARRLARRNDEQPARRSSPVKTHKLCCFPQSPSREAGLFVKSPTVLR
jgi:hypothetical protein